MALTALVQLVVVLIILGVVWWLVDAYIPMHPTMKRIINIVIIVAIILYLLSLVGINVLGALHIH